MVHLKEKSCTSPSQKQTKKIRFNRLKTLIAKSIWNLTRIFTPLTLLICKKKKKKNGPPQGEIL